MGVRLDELENVLSEKRWSQADLARRSGLSEHTVGRAVRDSEPVSERSANRIARALQVQVDNLRRKQNENNMQACGEHHIEPRRLKEAMTTKGMNPTELAAKTGLSVATVSSAIRGTRRPQTSTIKKIAEAVGEDITSRYSRSSAVPEQPVEIKARAGQKSTVFYPDDEPVTENVEDQQASKPADQEPYTRRPIAVPETVVAARIETSEQTHAQGSGTLEDLYSHLQQTRRMMAALLEHVGSIEEYIRQALVAGTEGRNGTG